MGPGRPQPSEPPVKILIAEDSPTQAQQLRHILMRQGYEVAVAANGRIALEMVPRFQPTLIISDVVMPEMDGYELSRAIKADSHFHDIPVILVTTMSDPQDVIRGLECGADNFVLKPYDEHYLMSRVRYVILNREIRRPHDAGMGVEIYFNDQRHFITADRLQILNLLLSTYDAAIQRNKELNRSQETLEKRSAEISSVNRFLDSLIDNIPDMIVVKEETELRFVRINRAAEELLGYSREELLGKNDDDLFPKEQADFFRAKDREVLALGRVEDIPEEPVQTRNKGIRILHTKKVPVLDEHGRRNLLGISEDVTEQRETEREIRRLNEDLTQRAAELQAANRDLESFTYSVSHDLRAPLRALDGFARILQEEYASSLDEEGARYLTVISESSRKMGALIDHLLAFSRLGRQAVTRSLVDMNTLVKEVVEEALQTHQGTAPKVEVGPLPPAEADHALIRQVWVNLISNALKYSGKSPAPVIEVSGRRDSTGTVYSVRDNGAGFDMTYYSKLFGVFQRLHSSSDFAGTGVGLAIVQRVVTRHGGRVWAEGKVNEGATFSFLLPATDEG